MKVTEDPSQVSYVRCEKCQEKWAAFGGRNTTRISLLSTTTTEPDSIDRQVHYKLVQIVEMAVAAKASLSTLSESSPPVISRQPSKSAFTNASPRVFVASDSPILPVPSQRDVNEVDQEQHEILESTPVTSQEQAKPLRKRDRTVQFLSKLKGRLTTQLSRLRRAQLKPKVPLRQPAASTRRLEESPTRTSQTMVLNVVPIDNPSATMRARSPLAEDTAEATSSSRDSVDKPTGRLAEVVTFIAGLDQDRLSSLDDQERAKWMRETYTDFKNRNRKSLRYSSITETSIAPFAPPLPVHFNRRSYEVFGAGSHHIEGLRAIESRPRRHSIATSDGISEQMSMLDGSTVVSVALTAGTTHTQRPRPETSSHLPVVDRSSVQSHRRSRRSLELSLHSRVGSLTSLRGHAGSRLSQGSMTAYGSMTNIPEMFLQYDEHRPSSPEPPLSRPTSL